jgi:hypothetical protein
MTPSNKPNPLLEIAITIVIPAVILMKLSSADRLGPLWALLLGLAFPLAWGLWQVRAGRKFGLMAAIGVFSTVLTGGIGLMKLDAQWLAVKEAAVPGIIGLVVAGSAFTRSPLIRTLLYQRELFDVDRIHAVLVARQNEAQFDDCLRRGTFMLAATFFFSSVMNFILARYVVTSPAGTEAFNEELGRLTLLSYPIIALPSMAMMMGLIFWLTRNLKALTGLTMGDLLAGGPGKAA